MTVGGLQPVAGVPVDGQRWRSSASAARLSHTEVFVTGNDGYDDNPFRPLFKARLAEATETGMCVVFDNGEQSAYLDTSWWNVYDIFISCHTRPSTLFLTVIVSGTPPIACIFLFFL